MQFVRRAACINRHEVAQTGKYSLSDLARVKRSERIPLRNLLDYQRIEFAPQYIYLDFWCDMFQHAPFGAVLYPFEVFVDGLQA